MYGRYKVTLIAAVLFLAPFTGCATKDYTALPKEIKSSPVPSSPYRIQSGDTLEVKFPYTVDHNEEVMVRPDGVISLGVTGEVAAAGKSPEELARAIRQSASRRLKNPKVVVTVKSSTQKIFVGGEVGDEGPVTYHENITALQAIVERGGFKNTARTDWIIHVQIKNGITHTRQMDMKEMASTGLAPNDVLYVPKTGIAKANLAVEQYLWRMIPFSFSRSW